MHVSNNKAILELAFIALRDTGALYCGSKYYSELHKNTLKNFLKTTWNWDKHSVIRIIKYWLTQDFLELNGNVLIFKFITVKLKNKNKYIDRIN